MNPTFTPKKPIPRKLEVGTGILVSATLLAAWCLLTYGGIVKSNFLPRPDEVLLAFGVV